MSISPTHVAGSQAPDETSAHKRQLDAIAWSLFLIWIGFAVLAKIGWPWSLLGVSAIILGTQALLWMQTKTVDSFAIACGLVFLAGGGWELLGLTWPLAPVLLILLGAGMLLNAIVCASSRQP